MHGFLSAIELAPPTQKEFEIFYEGFTSDYAETMYKNRLFADREEAIVKAEAEMQLLFPQGLETKGQNCFKIKDEQFDVGFLWYSEKVDDLGTYIWLCYIYVEPEFRRRGYAKSALLEMEKEVRSTGISRIGLNVFSTTPFAKNFYESLGFGVKDTFFTPDSAQVARYEMWKSL